MPAIARKSSDARSRDRLDDSIRTHPTDKLVRGIRKGDGAAGAPSRATHYTEHDVLYRDPTADLPTCDRIDHNLSLNRTESD